MYCMWTMGVVVWNFGRHIEEEYMIPVCLFLGFLGCTFYSCTLTFCVISYVLGILLRLAYYIHSKRYVYILVPLFASSIWHPSI